MDAGAGNVISGNTDDGVGLGVADVLVAGNFIGTNAAGSQALPNGGDGVEEVGNGDLIVSEWIGNVFYVYADGRKVQMLDRKPEKKNTADIWYDQKTKTLYVPGFFGKTITAYRVNI